MNLLTAMTTFVRVVETGSFTAVAREQGSLQPAISKQIAWLEGHLGNRLIERTTRRLLFTDQALAYYEDCKLILDSVGDAEKRARKTQANISGEIRVAASVGLGSFQLAPFLPGFLAQHPQMSVDLRLSDTYVDVVAEGVDIAFRIGQPGEPNVVSRRLGIIRPIIIASATYLKTHGRPTNLAQLASHRCVIISGRQTISQWRFDDDTTPTFIPKGPLSTDSGVGARALVLADAGIALLPRWLFTAELKSGSVEHLLPDASIAKVDLFAITPQSRRHSSKVSIFLDYIADILVQEGAIELVGT
jgi:DNA-binding transcriptional LysR family regulator